MSGTSTEASSVPVPLLGGVHLPVWWTSLYAAFVVFLAVEK